MHIRGPDRGTLGHQRACPLEVWFATMSAAPRTPNWIERLVAFVVVFAALATGCSGSDVGREEGVPGVTKAGNLSVFKLLPGDCLGDLDKLTDQLEAVPVEPCTDVHRIEVYYVPVHPAETYPGEAELVTYADGICLAEFGSYTGVDYFSVGNSLYFSYLYPTFASWNESEDRSIVCVVGSSADLNDSVAGRGMDLPVAPAE